LFLQQRDFFFIPHFVATHADIEIKGKKKANKKAATLHLMVLMLRNNNKNTLCKSTSLESHKIIFLLFGWLLLLDIAKLVGGFFFKLKY
jgi:hypothetical protein